MCFISNEHRFNIYVWQPTEKSKYLENKHFFLIFCGWSDRQDIEFYFECIWSSVKRIQLKPHKNNKII